MNPAERARIIAAGQAEGARLRTARPITDTEQRQLRLILEPYRVAS